MRHRDRVARRCGGAADWRAAVSSPDGTDVQWAGAPPARPWGARYAVRFQAFSHRGRPRSAAPLAAVPRRRAGHLRTARDGLRRRAADHIPVEWLSHLPGARRLELWRGSKVRPARDTWHNVRDVLDVWIAAKRGQYWDGSRES